MKQEDVSALFPLKFALVYGIRKVPANEKILTLRRLMSYIYIYIYMLRSWVRILPGAWIFVCCECRVLSGRGPCDELITRPEESYRLCCVVVCALETSRMGAPYIHDISRLRVNIVESVRFTYYCGLFGLLISYLVWLLIPYLREFNSFELGLFLLGLCVYDYESRGNG